ncbi:MAG: hypothetical protein Fur0032_18840 [Terrimicrobiaceae bacterium]
MRGMATWLAAACTLILVAAAGGQMSEQEKRELFLRAREDIRPAPRASATPRPRPKPSVTPRRTPTPTPRPTAPPRSTPDRNSNDRPASTPQADNPTTPTGDDDDVIPLEEDLNRPTPKPTPTATPKRTPEPGPTDSPKKPTGGRPMDAPIKIEKSGLADEAGYEPAKSSGGGGWFKRYRYLTPSIRRAIDQAPVRKSRWRYIIVHNSGTRQGSARAYDNYHRRVRKMQNGLAYHFVIGNGRGAGDGEIEIGSRWTRQINGGHVASDYLNNIALGICLTGDLNRDKPTAAQIAALEELIDYLRRRVGKTNGKPAAVRGHKQINPKPTDCPGDRFDLRWLRKRFGY